MKAHIWPTERYPDFVVEEADSPECVDVPDDVFERWQGVIAAYDDAQEEIEAYYKKQPNMRQVATRVLHFPDGTIERAEVTELAKEESYVARFCAQFGEGKGWLEKRYVYEYSAALYDRIVQLSQKPTRGECSYQGYHRIPVARFDGQNFEAVTFPPSEQDEPMHVACVALLDGDGYVVAVRPVDAANVVINERGAA